MEKTSFHTHYFAITLEKQELLKIVLLFICKDQVPEKYEIQVSWILLVRDRTYENQMLNLSKTLQT